MLRITGKLLVFVLSIFAIFLGICAVLGIQIYFPFNVAEGEEIPYHRMQSIRVAVFITFTYYGALYLINSIKEVYPIHFLKVFMISFGITSLVFSYQGEACLICVALKSTQRVNFSLEGNQEVYQDIFHPHYKLFCNALYNMV